MSTLKKIALLAGAVLAVLLVGTAAQAIQTVRSGGIADQQRFIHQTDATEHGSTTFLDVATAAVTVTIPAGQTRLLDARFSAESQCTGTTGWCSVRIVVLRPDGTVLELDPVAGPDFAFDSVSTDNWESHAIERTSPRLPAGAYRVKVQAAVVGATSLRLDDWTFALAMIR
jgi:hypothetical protein